MLSPPTPDPAYPEYADLREEAQRRSRHPVNPAAIAPLEAAIHRRGFDWATAVLGFSYPGLRDISLTDAELLRIADERDITPPLAQSIIDARCQAEQRREQATARRRQVDEADVCRWADVAKQVTVELVVRRNSTARVNHSGRRVHLGHAVPITDVYSGTRAARRHPAGRALCESEGRKVPLRLETSEHDPDILPVTCQRCLFWAPKVRTTP